MINLELTNTTENEENKKHVVEQTNSPLKKSHKRTKEEPAIQVSQKSKKKKKKEKKKKKKMEINREIERIE